MPRNGRAGAGTLVLTGVPEAGDDHAFPIALGAVGGRFENWTGVAPGAGGEELAKCDRCMPPAVLLAAEACHLRRTKKIQEGRQLVGCCRKQTTMDHGESLIDHHRFVEERSAVLLPRLWSSHQQSAEEHLELPHW